MNKRRRGCGCLTFVIILGVIAGAMHYWTNMIKTEYYELRFAGLPAAFDGYRIAVVSDLHAAVFGDGNEKLYNAVRKGSPDMIAVTGDITDSAGQIDSVMETMRELVKIAPVYYVTGNHEWEKGEVRELFNRLPEAGVTVMRNVVIPLTMDDETIYIAGLEDPNGPADMKTPAEVLGQVPEDCYTVTLVHRNTFLEELAGLGTDLILCGHGHGGMIRLPVLGGLFGHDFTFLPDFTSGEYTIGKTTIIVSRGIGNNTGIPRIGNNPHIPVVILRQET